MKINIKAILIALLLLGFDKATHAQGPSAPDNEDIVIPVTIAKTIDIGFRSLVLPATPAASVVISPSGNYVIYAPGNNGYPIYGSSASAASFSLTGIGNYLYAILLPQSCVIIDRNSNHIVADMFTSEPKGNGILSPDGTQTLNIGATFKIYTQPIRGNKMPAIAAPVIINYN